MADSEPATTVQFGFEVIDGRHLLHMDVPNASWDKFVDKQSAAKAALARLMTRHLRAVDIATRSSHLRLYIDPEQLGTPPSYRLWLDKLRDVGAVVNALQEDAPDPLVRVDWGSNEANAAGRYEMSGELTLPRSPLGAAAVYACKRMRGVASDVRYLARDETHDSVFASVSQLGGVVLETLAGEGCALESSGNIDVFSRSSIELRGDNFRDPKQLLVCMYGAVALAHPPEQLPASA